MGISLRSRLGLALAVVVALSLVATASVVATTLLRGGTAKVVKTATSDTQWQLTSTSFTDVSGMSLSINVPPNSHADLVITYSSAILAVDLGGSVAGTADLQVLVNGVGAAPGVSRVWAFDSIQSDGKGDERSGSMQWVAGPLAAGSYTVTVQARTTDGTYDTFFFRNGTLTVMRLKTT